MEEIVPKDGGNVYHGGTYNAHPVSMAAGLETLKILSKPGRYKEIDSIGDSLFNGLRDSAEDRGVDVWVENIGSLGELYFSDKEMRTWRDAFSIDGDKWRHWLIHSLGRGVFFGVPHADEHFFTSLAHSKMTSRSRLRFRTRRSGRLRRPEQRTRLEINPKAENPQREGLPL